METTKPSELNIPTWYVPRDYQRDVWKYMVSAPEPITGKRAVLVWPRRHGKDLTCLNIVAYKAILQRPGNYYYYFPEMEHGRKAIWENRTGEGHTFMSVFPDWAINRTNAKTMTLELTNYDLDKTVAEGQLVEKGTSVFQMMGAKEADRTVGTNPVGVVLSEYSVSHVQYEKTWNFIRPILTENKGFAMFPYTARGMNHGYRLYTMNKDNPSWHVEYHTSDTARHNGERILSEEMIEEERLSGMSEELIQQEYYNNWESASEAAYYGRVCDLPWDPAIPVHTCWDIGHSDATAIWFFQIMRDGWVNFIDYYEMRKEGLEHYVKLVREKPYNYGDHIAPHDMKVTEWGTSKTRLEAAWALGLRFRVAPKLGFDQGIDAVKAMLQRARFDKRKCARGVEALKHYSRQNTGIVDLDGKPIFSSKPIHDHTSHPADSIRYGAVVIDTIATIPYDGNIVNMTPTIETDYNMFDF